MPESGIFQEFIKKSGYELIVRDDISVAAAMKVGGFLGATSFGVPSMDNPLGTSRADIIIRNNKTIELNPAAQAHLDWTFHSLLMEVGPK